MNLLRLLPLLAAASLSAASVSTFAGTGEKGYSGDGGPALAASLNLPHEIRFDRAGDLYIVDMQNHRVRDGL